MLGLRNRKFAPSGRPLPRLLDPSQSPRPHRFRAQHEYRPAHSRTGGDLVPDGTSVIRIQGGQHRTASDAYAELAAELSMSAPDVDLVVAVEPHNYELQLRLTPSSAKRSRQRHQRNTQ